VAWDCSSGGQLTVRAAGIGIALTIQQECMILVAAILGALLLLAFRLRGGTQDTGSPEVPADQEAEGL
jgi:hypothetical protein